MAFLTLFECELSVSPVTYITGIANNMKRNVHMHLNTRIFPTTGYAQVLLFMFIRRELGGTGTGCTLFCYMSFCFELQ